jgi:hypothetical protein
MVGDKVVWMGGIHIQQLFLRNIAEGATVVKDTFML